MPIVVKEGDVILVAGKGHENYHGCAGSNKRSRFGCGHELVAVFADSGKENGADTVDQEADQEDSHGATQTARFHGHVWGTGI